MRRVANVEVFLGERESQESLLRRFSKKCKKQDIVKEYLDKTSCFKSKSQKRKEKSLKAQYIRNKEKSKGKSK